MPSYYKRVIGYAYAVNAAFLPLYLKTPYSATDCLTENFISVWQQNLYHKLIIIISVIKHHFNFTWSPNYKNIACQSQHCLRKALATLTNNVPINNLRVDIQARIKPELNNSGKLSLSVGFDLTSKYSCFRCARIKTAKNFGNSH